MIKHIFEKCIFFILIQIEVGNNIISKSMLLIFKKKNLVCYKFTYLPKIKLILFNKHVFYSLKNTLIILLLVFFLIKLYFNKQ